MHLLLLNCPQLPRILTPGTYFRAAPSIALHLHIGQETIATFHSPLGTNLKQRRKSREKQYANEGIEHTLEENYEDFPWKTIQGEGKEGQLWSPMAGFKSSVTSKPWDGEVKGGVDELNCQSLPHPECLCSAPSRLLPPNGLQCSRAPALRQWAHRLLWTGSPQ